jgi:hypothetical protein
VEWSGRAPARRESKLARVAEDKEHAMFYLNNAIVSLDGRGAVVLPQKWWRGQVEARLANMRGADRYGGLRWRA